MACSDDALCGRSWPTPGDMLARGALLRMPQAPQRVGG